MGIIEYFITISPVLWEGLVFTLLFTFVGMIAGFFLAVPLCLVSLYTHGIGKKLTDIYVAIIRGTPMLIQLYMIYYGFPKFLLPLGITVTPYLAAFVGFIINSTAYQIEYMKGGFKAISYEQMEAARSIGMSTFQMVKTILLPQGLRFSVPALSNELIYLLKYTSLGFVIQAPELMTKSKELASTHARYMETYLIAAFIYVFLTFILSKLTDVIDEKLRIPGFEPEKIR
ncbi:MAG: amino acid ABC transporter permease [Spirochaetaceae bacterium]